MKYTLIYALMFVAIGCAAQQNSDEKIIHKTLMTFSKAADENNVELLAPLLDDQFRIVMNQLFGSQEVSLINKSTYLEKIGSGEWGGDRRQVSVESLVIVGRNASVKLTLTGEKMTMISLISLVKDASGNWKILSDLPAIDA